MCNLHIKETEISRKRSKGIKNRNITYSVISNKTNLILGFSSPLMFSFLIHKHEAKVRHFEEKSSRTRNVDSQMS